MNEITTISFFKYHSFSDKRWAFTMMQWAHKDLKKVKGLQFYKLMGSGKGEGFNPLPDWSVYVLLMQWKNEAAAIDFFKGSSLMEQYSLHTSQQFHLFLRSISSHGTWSGKSPFPTSKNIDPTISTLAVITRATIKWHLLPKFWRQVPQSKSQLTSNPGLLYTKGIGEVPLIQMATFSIWDSIESLKKYAYQSPGHQEAIRKTRSTAWYKEELFARFQPYTYYGEWDTLRKPLPIPHSTF